MIDVRVGHYGDRKHNLATKKRIADAQFLSCSWVSCNAQWRCVIIIQSTIWHIFICRCNLCVVCQFWRRNVIARTEVGYLPSWLIYFSPLWPNFSYPPFCVDAWSVLCAIFGAAYHKQPAVNWVCKMQRPRAFLCGVVHDLCSWQRHLLQLSPNSIMPTSPRRPRQVSDNPVTSLRQDTALSSAVAWTGRKML